jgi:hypothetical protein
METTKPVGSKLKLPHFEIFLACHSVAICLVLLKYCETLNKGGTFTMQKIVDYCNHVSWGNSEEFVIDPDLFAQGAKLNINYLSEMNWKKESESRMRGAENVVYGTRLFKPFFGLNLILPAAAESSNAKRPKRSLSSMQDNTQTSVSKASKPSSESITSSSHLTSNTTETSSETNEEIDTTIISAINTHRNAMLTKLHYSVTENFVSNGEFWDAFNGSFERLQSDDYKINDAVLTRKGV